MRISIVALLCLLTVSMAFSASDITTVIQEFASSMPAVDPTCIADITQIAQLAQQIQKDVGTFNLPALTKDVKQLFDVVQKAITDCQKEDMFTELLENIMKSDNNMIRCAVELYQFGKNGISEVQSIEMTMQSLMTKVPALMQQYMQVQSTCSDIISFNILESLSEYAPNDLPTCIEDIKQIVPLAEQIKADVSKFDLVALAKDVKALQALVQKALVDCKF